MVVRKIQNSKLKNENKAIMFKVDPNFKNLMY